VKDPDEVGRPRYLTCHISRWHGGDERAEIVRCERTAFRAVKLPSP
jgi:hypothetical protein